MAIFTYRPALYSQKPDKIICLIDPVLNGHLEYRFHRLNIVALKKCGLYNYDKITMVRYSWLVLTYTCWPRPSPILPFRLLFVTLG